MSSKKRNTELVKLVRNHHVAPSVTDEAIRNILRSLDCPRSLAVWLLYSNREHEQLVNLTISPLDYCQPGDFQDAYCATEFLSKADFLDLPFDRKEVAYKKFHEYESLCKLTNHRFLRPHTDTLNTGASVWLLNATRRKVYEILGCFDGEELFRSAGWGPGVTTLLKGSDVSAVNKFHAERGITRDLYSLVSPLFSEAYPLWSTHISEFSIEIGNKIVTVPKNSKTDRVIAVEPGINLWFQKAAGSMIRARLRRFGIDLNSQRRNQELARVSSIDDSLATVDFSSASDSISRELVRELLPPDWFLLLDCLRSKLGFSDDGTLIRWEKFSSMGNGFTFELESLIFYAAAVSAASYLKLPLERISVFGDDVIIPSPAFDLYANFCEFLGFRVNKKKSFSSSYFRESCGSHWFSGVDCKPLYFKERIRNVQAIYRLANGLRLLGHRRNAYYGCDLRLRTAWSYLFHRVPRDLRFVVSFELGDLGFIGNFDEATPSRASHGIEGFFCTGLASLGARRYFDGEGLLLSRLWSSSTRHSLFRDSDTEPLTWDPRQLRLTPESGNYYTLRGITKLTIVRPLVKQWYNLGPWL
jgi:hypothetical protein